MNYVIIGFAAGIAMGMGLGGGTILIPMLTLLVGASQHSAQGVNLIAFLPAAAVAVYVNGKKDIVDFKTVRRFLPAGVLGCISGAVIAAFLDVNFIRYAFAVFIFIVGIYLYVCNEK